MGMGAAGAGPDPTPEVRVGSQQEQDWPGSSSLATDCVLNLVRLADRMLGYGLAITGEHGVHSVGAFNVLTILHGESGPLLPSTIASRMIVTRGTVSGLLGSLERQGFVERLPADHDGRQRPVGITSAGRAAVEAILPRLHEAELRWMACLTTAEQESLLGVLARIQTAGPDRS
jgi:DNA-binding MarR family transcriptional regulator